MKAQDHRQAAEQIEQTIATLQSDMQAHSRTIIEAAWGAAFHWIAYGCETKHHQHQENHQRLATYLKGIGETVPADLWTALDAVRVGGWYGTKSGEAEVLFSLDLLEKVRAWAIL